MNEATARKRAIAILADTRATYRPDWLALSHVWRKLEDTIAQALVEAAKQEKPEQLRQNLQTCPFCNGWGKMPDPDK